MKLRIPRVAVFALLLGVGGGLLAASIGHAAEPLTLEDVLRLHGGGLSDDIIASEILVTETVFDLSPSDLLRLKGAGISDALIGFMVDTGLDQQADTEEDAPDLDGSREAYADDGWLNVIEEEPAATTTFVTLNYDYPTWWYDSYWADYWYYDHHYYPYDCSYSWVYGAWYPTWFSYRYCYLPPYWGYRSHYYGAYGYDWNYAQCDSYYAGGGYYTADAHHTQTLSRTKYKSGGSSGKILYADMGLKVRDVERLTRTAARVDRPDVRRPIKDRIVVAEGRDSRPGGDRVRRPVKSTGLPERPSTGLGKPLDTRHRSASTLTRPTRRPVLASPPKPQVRTVDRPPTPVRTQTPWVERPRTEIKPPPATKPTRPAADATRTKPAKPTPPPEEPRPEVQPDPMPHPTPPQREPPRAAPAPPAPKSPPQATPRTKKPQPEPKSRSRPR